MKFVLYGVMVIGAFFLGKIMYGPLAPSLLGQTTAKATDSETVQEIKVKSPMGTITEVVDLEDVDPKDFPEKVTLASELILTDKNGLSPLKLDAGSPVTPLELEDMVLKVTSSLATHLTGEISVLETDFVEGVAHKRMDQRMAKLEADKAPAAPTPPTPKPVVEVAANNPAPKPAPMVEPEPAPAPAREPEPAPEPEAPTSLSADQIVAAMKASLEGGKIKELDASKVTNWEAGEDETFDGEEFQVGIATYKEMTILGEKTLQAKALFAEGQLEKWIHAKTGMEIR
ncbi:hypothetical protein AAFN60_12775 [Roseibacillus persicicus]|uniref:hypothetical protein n=1 Tax=Roseibacillus persicicus TaxID=454148 RepID=UPI00398B5B9D